LTTNTPVVSITDGTTRIPCVVERKRPEREETTNETTIDERRGGHPQGRNTDVFVSEVASMAGSLRLSEHWHVRATWDRIITSYDRDSDIFLGGIGYRF
jgi:hypothetical protein